MMGRHGIACVGEECRVAPAIGGYVHIEHATDAWNHRQPEIDEANYAREDEEREFLMNAMKAGCEGCKWEAEHCG